MTPYQTLRVKKKATAEEITKAFRKRSLETHPDRGGDAAELQAVVRAYRLLIDPAARKRYDETGGLPSDGADNANADLCQALANAFTVACEHCLGSGKTPGRIDLVHLMLASINEANKEIKKQCTVNKKAADFITEAMERFTGDDGGLMCGVLGGQLARLKNNLSIMEKRIDLNARVVEHLKKVDYRHEHEIRSGGWDSTSAACATITTY